ncbi:hypothetical protein BaRGS_00011879 [Batillaria attramentaria]|uniref:Uncharacterized protein n=1 Tax=Batillaria attramentaria TaxID=370345 RepID=A0ABD0LD43_9CAEN
MLPMVGIHLIEDQEGKRFYQCPRNRKKRCWGIFEDARFLPSDSLPIKGPRISPNARAGGQGIMIVRSRASLQSYGIWGDITMEDGITSARTADYRDHLECIDA